MGDSRHLSIAVLLALAGWAAPPLLAQSIGQPESVGKDVSENAFPDAAPRFIDDSVARNLARIRMDAKRGSNQSILACQELLDGMAGVGPLAGNARLGSLSDDVLGLDRSASGSTYARYGSLRGSVERLQRSLDEEAYLMATEPAAERLWDEFRGSRDISTLRMLVTRFFNTSRGDDACVMLAALALDRGDPVEAYALLDRVRSEHPRPDVDQRLLRRRLLVASARLGAVEEVRAEWSRMERDGMADDVPARVRREIERSTSDTRQTRRNPTVWNSGSGTADGRRLAPRIEDATALDDRVTEAWSLPLDGVEESRRFDADTVVPGWTQLKRSPVAHAVALEGRVYVHGRDGVVCREAETGRVLWQGRRSALATEPMLQEYGAKQAALELVARAPNDDETRWFSDRVRVEFAVQGDQVFVLEGANDLDSTTPIPPSTTQKRVRSNVLAAYEATTGQALWSRPANDERRGAAGFLGAPVAHDDLVLVPASFGGAVCLLGLDRENGETRWRTFVCDEPASGASPWSPVRVVVEGSAAYVLPGTGVVACLDATTGDVRWAVRYQRSSRLALNRQQRAKNPAPTFDFFGWERDTLLVGGRLLIVAPSDTERLFALDRRNGTLVWEANARPNPDAKRASLVLGASEDGLFVAGHAVLRRYRITDGDLDWETSLAGATGQGLVTPDALYVPTGSTLSVFDPATGEQRRSIEFVSGYGKPLGNLATDGERLYASGATRALALAPLEPQLELLAARIHKGDVGARLDRSALFVGLDRGDEAFDDLVAATASAPAAPAIVPRVLEALDQPVFDERRPRRVLRALAIGEIARTAKLDVKTQWPLIGAWRSVAHDCLKAISTREVPGAAAEILTVASLANDVYIQNLAEQALIGTATAADLPRLDEVVDTNPALRTMAIRALSSKRLVDVDGVTARLDALWKADDPVLRLTSAETLLARGDRRALDRLVTLLESDDAEIRAQAAGRLWRATSQRLAFDSRGPSDKRLQQVSAWRKWVAEFGADAEIRTDVALFTRTWGRVLVATSLGDFVAEYDSEGNETWQVPLNDAYRCWAMETGERVAVGWGYDKKKYVIVYAAGDGPPRELWSLDYKCRARPLPRGDILVYEHSGGIRRYDRTGRELWKTKVVWKGKPQYPLDANLLPNGNVRVEFWENPKAGPQYADTAIEIDSKGRVIRELPFDPKDELLGRLPNGNALVRIDDRPRARIGGRIEERDQEGDVVWSYTDRDPIRSAQRLPNGDTFINNADGIKVVRPDGTIAGTLGNLTGNRYHYMDHAYQY